MAYSLHDAGSEQKHSAILRRRSARYLALLFELLEAVIIRRHYSHYCWLHCCTECRDTDADDEQRYAAADEFARRAPTAG